MIRQVLLEDYPSNQGKPQCQRGYILKTLLNLQEIPLPIFLLWKILVQAL